VGAMTARTFEIQVQDDHLQRIAQVRKPILVIAELIWNAVDADANRVDVALHDDALGRLKSIEVVDNGHGILFTEAEDLFSQLGGSWKQGGRRSREQRRIFVRQGTPWPIPRICAWPRSGLECLSSRKKVSCEPIG
jgi:Histidine kinase-, DNA gyrase B-, and HSP90-like ATPase